MFVYSQISFIAFVGTTEMAIFLSCK